MATDDTRAHLQELEAELDEYPDQRGEILLEIAAAWLEAGEPDRAVVIWRDLIAEGGEDEDYARVELAEYLFGIGEDESARAELAALMATRRTAGGGWQLAAELLEERGELAEALVWYTMATERFTTDEMATLGDDAGWVSVPGMLVRRRREVRTAMGLPPTRPINWCQLRRGSLNSSVDGSYLPRTPWTRCMPAAGRRPRSGSCSGRGLSSTRRASVGPTRSTRM